MWHALSYPGLDILGILLRHLLEVGDGNLPLLLVVAGGVQRAQDLHRLVVPGLGLQHLQADNIQLKIKEFRQVSALCASASSVVDPRSAFTLIPTNLDSTYHPDADPDVDPDSDFYLMRIQIRIFL